MIFEQELIQKHIDSVWPGWVITGRLGTGTYGSVYEIKRTNFGAGGSGNSLTCALKVLHIEAGGYDLDKTSAAAAQSSQYQERLTDREEYGQSRLNRTSNAFMNRARQVNPDSLHAASLIYPPMSDSMIAEFVTNVSAEINTMIELKGHPHIVTIEDYHIYRDEQFCMIMIRMEELDCLSKYIRRGINLLSREKIIQIGVDICSALELCEQRNIIHRDIKPGNIFLSEINGYKLGDFGISRTMESIYENATMSGIGTLHYMAPEVYAGGKYNNTADIYSLGMVLYVLMNDSFLPFIRESLDSTGQRRERESCFRRLNGEKLPAPSKADLELAGVILKACSYAPEDRFRTAAEFREALERCRVGSKSGADNVQKDNILEKYKHLIYAGAGILAAAAFFMMGAFWNAKTSVKEPVSGTGEITDETDAESRTVEPAAVAEKADTSIVSEEQETLSDEEIDPEDDILTFPDPALEKAIRRELNMEDEEPITSDRALEVESLVLTGGGMEKDDKITDITGLAAFENLTELNLQSNQITNIEELSSLKKLRKLKVESNKIQDLSPLGGLSELRKLEAAHNNVSDLEPIFSLRKLEVLDVINNNISTIQGIGGLIKLNTLRIGRNNITDISPVAELQDLTDLSFGYNQVEDISCLYALPMLHVLTMNYNRIRDIGPVAEMKELNWLEVTGNPIEDDSILENLPDSVTHLER